MPEDHRLEFLGGVLFATRAPVKNAQLPARQPVIRVDHQSALQDVHGLFRLPQQGQRNALARESLGALRVLLLEEAKLGEGLIVAFFLNEQHSSLINCIS